MSILDVLLGGSGKSLRVKELDKMLKTISALSPEEREYVKAVFGKFMNNGISKMEAEETIRNLKLDHMDNIDAVELEKIRLKILSFFV